MKISHLFNVLILLLFLVSPTKYAHSDSEKQFSTNFGLGIDKWSSIWMIENYLSSKPVRILDTDKVESFPNAENFKYFDTPNSDFQRTHNSTALSKIRAHYGIDAPELAWFESKISEIELDYWKVEKKTVESQALEEHFRRIQRNQFVYQNIHSCTSLLFDATVQYFDQLAIHENERPSLDSKLKDICSESSEIDTGVINLPMADLLRQIKFGTSVKFVDVREPSEYEERHIPGAINLPIRDLGDTSLETLESADLVIAYCVKDFRGFEMAVKLKERGIKNVALLSPFGLNGWLKTGLPLYVNGEVTEQESLNLLRQCTDPNSNCYKTLKL